MIEERFETILRESINEELRNTLGEKARQVILRHIEKDKMLTEENIGKRVEVFEEGLDQFFKAGSTILKESIIRNLYSKLNLRYDQKADFDFLECIMNAKKASGKKAVTKSI